MKFKHLLHGERALDIACGGGRNSRYMRGLGFEVDAVDISDVALAPLREEGINTIEADLDTYSIEESSYDLIFQSHYLNRRLFPHIKEGLKPGGIAIIETFVLKKGYLPNLSNKDHMLRENELLISFIDLEVLYYHEREIVKFNNQKDNLATILCKKR